MTTTVTAADQTARILAEHRDVTGSAEYAIHQALGRYDTATAGLMCLHCMQSAARQLRSELTAALAAFDHDCGPGDRETGVITGARERLAPLAAHDAWLDREVAPGRACRA